MTIPYGKQFITDDDIKAVEKVLRSDFLTQGPAIEIFEKAFAEFVDAKYAVAVCNGTAALHLATIAMDIRPKDTILTTPISFVATSNSALYCQAEVDFVDINEKNFCIDIDKLEQKLEQNPNKYRAIYAVSLGGYPVDMERISKLAFKYGLKVLEDACHSPGSKRKNTYGKWYKSGSCTYSDTAVFSLHPVKHIAAGEGGVITTNNHETYKKLLRLRTHGITKDKSEFIHQKNKEDWRYEMHDLGYNYRMSDVNAALAFSQLTRIQENILNRQEIASKYREQLYNLPLLFQEERKDILNSYHLFIIRTRQREKLFRFLKEKNIFTQIHYIPIHTQPYYVRRYGVQFFEIAENYSKECLSIPMFHGLQDKEQALVIDAIHEAHKSF